MFKKGDKVKIRLDLVLGKYKKYTGVYKIEKVITVKNQKQLYKLKEVPDYGTEELLELAE